ncbi:MAG: replicative DNA helicase [Planctomycetota bacterium]
MARGRRKIQGEETYPNTDKKNSFLAGQSLTPASREAEIALIGSILINQNACGAVAEIIAPKDFYFSENRIIAEVIWDLFDSNSNIDPVLVHEELVKLKTIELVGGSDYFFKIEESIPDSSHAQHYARIIKEKALLRGMVSTCHEILEDIANSSSSAEEILDRSESKILRVAQGFNKGETQHIGPLLHHVLEEIDARLGSGSEIITGIPSGIPALDNLTSGFQRTELIILAARPSMGKTTLALNIAEHAAVKEKMPVAIFSLESSAERIAHNIMCSHARIDSHKLRTGFLSKEEWPKIGMACGALSDVPIYIEDTMPISTFAIKTKARRLKAQYDIQLIVVDYLQMIESNKGWSNADNRQQEIAEISRHLKSLAKELHIPVIAISQLNRAPEARKDGKPRLSDLRESGAIEQDADVVLLLWREGYYEEAEKRQKKKTDLATVEIAKQRNGPTGVVKLLFNGSCLRFDPIAQDADEFSGLGDYDGGF